MMDVLLSNAVVQEAAVKLVPSTDPSSPSSPESSGSSSGSDSPGSSSPPSPPSSPAEGVGREPSASSSKGKGKGKAKVEKERPLEKVPFLRTCLVVVPKNVLINWRQELEKVYGGGEVEFSCIYVLPFGPVIVWLFWCLLSMLLLACFFALLVLCRYVTKTTGCR